MSEREPALAADEAQEQRNGARRTAEMAAIHWQELEASGMPPRACEMVFEHWLRFVYTPQIEIPDFSGIFGTKKEEE